MVEKRPAYNPWLYNLIILICQNSILRIKDEKTGLINDFIIQQLTTLVIKIYKNIHSQPSKS